jgi:hypothetical protein
MMFSGGLHKQRGEQRRPPRTEQIILPLRIEEAEGRLLQSEKQVNNYCYE